MGANVGTSFGSLHRELAAPLAPRKPARQGPHVLAVVEHGPRFSPLQVAAVCLLQSTALAMAPTTVSNCAACAGDAAVAFLRDDASDDELTFVFFVTLTAADASVSAK